MQNLKNNIDYYMQLKGIRKYSDLLADVAKHLGYHKEVEISAFVRNEKSNFSKMLQGQRPLKYEFIIPLETIFGAPLSRILNEEAYKLPVEKGSIPFDKGFRYYAYVDDYDLYVNEFDRKIDKRGNPIMSNYDEFGKSFLEYIIEYGAKNGVRYLYDVYGICTYGYWNDMMTFTKKKHFFPLPFDNKIGFARLVASMNDADLFFNIYDSYRLFFSNGHYGGKDSLFNSDVYQILLMDNPHLFEKLFEIKHYEYEYHQRDITGMKVMKIKHADIPNPILNKCLDYALRHTDRYSRQAKRILEFGIEYNADVIGKFGSLDIFNPGDDLGGITSFKDRDFLSFMIMTYEPKVKDKELVSLIERLPKLVKYF